MAGSMGGQAMANAANAKQAGIQREWQGKMALANRNWQTMEANKARSFQHDMMTKQNQYMVKDLKAAGLNPMLAVSKGISPVGTGMPSGAGTGGSGAAATAQNVMSSAMDAANFFREVKSTNAQIKLNKALEQKAKSENLQVQNAAKSINLDNKVKQAYLPSHKEQALAEKTKAEFNKTNATSDSWLRRILPWWSKPTVGQTIKKGR